MESLIEIIRGLREDADLKQSEIANIIGTTQQQYSKYETGESELPIRALVTLAGLYDVSADFLLARTDCRQGIDGLSKSVTTDYTVGKLISNVLSLSHDSRKALIEYINLLILKERSHRQ